MYMKNDFILNIQLNRYGSIGGECSVGLVIEPSLFFIFVFYFAYVYSNGQMVF